MQARTQAAMVNQDATITVETIAPLILTIRGQRVMLDSDLARVYGVTTKRLKEQFRRNIARFPRDFAFELTSEEFANLRSQNAISSSHGGTNAPVREIGFHIREEPVRYRTRRQRNGK